jgi:hypothetical protein
MDLLHCMTRSRSRAMDGLYLLLYIIVGFHNCSCTNTEIPSLSCIPFTGYAPRFFFDIHECQSWIAILAVFPFG